MPDPADADRPDLASQRGASTAVGSVSFRVANLWSQLRFDSIHFSDRRYQVLTQDGKIVPGELPALVGKYGVTAKTLAMPRHWTVAVEPSFVSGLSLALLGVGNQGAVAVRQSVSLGPVLGWVQTVNARNLSLGVSARWGQHAEAGIAVTARGVDQPLLSLLSLSARW